MKEYKFTYKCLMCGKEFTDGITGSKEVATREMGLALIGKSTMIPTTLSHQCEDNNFGVAYFSGIKCCEVEHRIKIKYKDNKPYFAEV